MAPSKPSNLHPVVWTSQFMPSPYLSYPRSLRTIRRSRKCLLTLCPSPQTLHRFKCASSPPTRRSAKEKRQRLLSSLYPQITHGLWATLSDSSPELAACRFFTLLPRPPTVRSALDLAIIKPSANRSTTHALYAPKITHTRPTDTSVRTKNAPEVATLRPLLVAATLPHYSA